jgi:D-alanyl-D-alanine carboxypeptidase
VAARGLCEFEEAGELELAEIAEDGREWLLVPPAAAAWRTMKDAASRDGVNIFLASAFRSVERQAEIVRRKLGQGEPIEQILSVLAPPGFSEHHTGRAVDIATPGCPPVEIEFEDTEAFRWLSGNAERFGFRLSFPRDNPFGYQYEPWHWCFAA